MLTLGIPGSAPAAVMLGALMTPRPEAGLRSVLGAGRHRIHLYVRADPVELHHPAARPRAGAYLRAGAENSAHFLVVAILALSVVGSYSISSSLMDVLSMAACGLLGYVLVRYKYGVAPMALGLILRALRWRKDSSCRFISERRKEYHAVLLLPPAEPCAYHPYAAFARVFHLEGMRGQEGLIFGTYRLYCTMAYTAQ